MRDEEGPEPPAHSLPSTGVPTCAIPPHPLGSRVCSPLHGHPAPQALVTSTGLSQRNTHISLKWGAGWLGQVSTKEAKGSRSCSGSQSLGSCRFADQRRRNRECKYVQERERLRVIDHSFTGTRPKLRKGEAGRLARTGLCCPEAGPAQTTGSLCWTSNL